MRDFLLGVLVILVLAAMGLGGFGVYGYVSLDGRLAEVGNRLDSELAEFSQRLGELQEHHLLIPYRVFVPPQLKVSNIEKSEASITFKVWNAFSIPAISVSLGETYEFPAQATVRITDPYSLGDVEVRAVTIIDAKGNIIVDSEPIPVSEASFISIDPTA